MIKPCKCGSHQRSKQAQKPIVDRLVIGPGFAVTCQACGDSGPHANTEDEAIYLWNEYLNTER